MWFKRAALPSLSVGSRYFTKAHEPIQFHRGKFTKALLSKETAFPAYQLEQQENPSNTLLNMDFYMQIAKNVGLKELQKGSNFLFSPLSVHTVLSMVATGSSGRTSEQILYFLKSESTPALNSVAAKLMDLISVDGTQKGGPRLAFINGVWVEKSFTLKPSFKEIMNTVYKSEAKDVDFLTKANEVRKEVNSWAESATDGLIKEILPHGSLDSSTIFVLANALYFKGAWINKFVRYMTQNREFYLLDGNTVRVPFMSNREGQYVRSFDGFKVLRLPYKQGHDQRQFSMYIFLPDKKDELPSLMEKLGSDSGFLNELAHLPKVEVGKFWVPKFKISLAMEASNVMKELGLVLPFSEVAAEFTEMVNSEKNLPIWVSNIFHKSVVEVNEEGTEAAAVTSTGAGCCRWRPRHIDFVADHPFMFIIREEMEGVTLFVGNVIDPSKTD